jgi:hypothetical protein
VFGTLYTFSVISLETVQFDQVIFSFFEYQGPETRKSEIFVGTLMVECEGHKGNFISGMNTHCFVFVTSKIRSGALRTFENRKIITINKIVFTTKSIMFACSQDRVISNLNVPSLGGSVLRL